MNYFFQIWFWVCCDPIEEPFMIMTLNYDYVLIDEMTTNTDKIPRFQIGVNGDGNFFFSNLGVSCPGYCYH